MNKVMLVIIFLLMLSGCTKKQDLTQKSGSVVPAQEIKQVESTQTLPSSRVAEIAKEEGGVVEEKMIDVGAEGTSAPVESVAQVTPSENITKEIQTQVKDMQQQQTSVKSIKGAEEIIAENSWGFSAYDPQSGIVEYYTSNGMLLGKMKK